MRLVLWHSEKERKVPSISEHKMELGEKILGRWLCQDIKRRMKQDQNLYCDTFHNGRIVLH